MINFIKEQLAISKLKKNLRAYTRPDRAFLKSVREKFVAVAGHQTGVVVRTRHPRSWKYATVAVVAVLSMTSGMAVFADANNVPVTHPLYNLKRVSEQVRVGLSSPTQQVELHRIFAHRRLEEVSELETNKDKDNNPISSQSQKRIDKLDKDFENETETGLNKAKEPQVKKEVRQQFCQDILDAMQKRPQSNRANQAAEHMTDRVKARCGEAQKNQAD